jgi:hypothetical protein
LLFALWIIIGCWRDEQFYQAVIVREFLGNLAGASGSVDGGNGTGRHWASVLTYPAQLLHRLFPWSLALLIWLVADAKGRARLLGDAGARWTVAWFACGLVVMSLIPGRRADRIFPVVPPLAILGAYVVRFASSPQAGRFTRWRIVQGLTLGAVMVWGSYTLFAATLGRTDEVPGLRQFCNRVMTWERTEGRQAVIVGPIPADDQALPVYLRRTTCRSLESALLGDGRGEVALILREAEIDKLDNAGKRYRIVETQIAREVKGCRHFLVTMAIQGGR